MLREDGKQSTMVSWTKRLLLTFTISGPLATNVLTLIASACRLESTQSKMAECISQGVIA
jgi:hypothetical protein